MSIATKIVACLLAAVPAFAAAADTSCPDLLNFPPPAAQGDTPRLITDAKLVKADAAWPEHCDVFGKLHERKGLFGQTYAIRFHLRLPTDWNHRFFFQGGAGPNGVIGDALGHLQGEQGNVALSLGYAVVSQDGGHDRLTNNDPERSGINAFSWDPIARTQNAHASQAAVTVAAKALIERYYGSAPRYSYFVACSKGGQEGMAMSERYPDYFDGIMANAPGFALPKAALAQVWNTQGFAELARKEGLLDENGLPLIGRTFSDADLAIVSDAVLSACDKLDGLSDGIVTNFPACTTARVVPALNKRACEQLKNASCLSAAQITSLLRAFAGPRNSRGEALYSDWAWDSGIGGQAGAHYFTSWRQAILGKFSDTHSISPGAAALATSFFSPPVKVRDTPADYLRFALAVDFDRDSPKIFQASGAYTPAAWDLVSARGLDRTAFKARGGKMIVVHGVSDPVFSINDTLAWWREVDRREQGHAADFVRVFAVPGMAHCGGGPGTVQFDAFSALVNWVEESSPPTRIVATAPAGTPWPGRTRPLCAYPTQARYKGGGIDDARNFVCTSPAQEGGAGELEARTDSIDPLYRSIGDRQRSYYFAADDVMSPYRIYVPSAWKPGKSLGMVTILHGGGGNQDEPFDRAPPGHEGELQRLADQHGFILLSPYGYRGFWGSDLPLPPPPPGVPPPGANLPRATAGGTARPSATDHSPEANRIRKLAEQDVMNVIRRTLSEYDVDTRRVYLMGNSGGAIGTMFLAMSHPDVWAAIAPSNGPVQSSSFPFARLKGIKGAFVIHGALDRLTSEPDMRAQAEGTRAQGIETRYVNVAGAGHGDAFYAVLPEIFDFFASHAR